MSNCCIEEKNELIGDMDRNGLLFSTLSLSTKLYQNVLLIFSSCLNRTKIQVNTFVGTLLCTDIHAN